MGCFPVLDGTGHLRGGRAQHDDRRAAGEPATGQDHRLDHRAGDAAGPGTGHFLLLRPEHPQGPLHRPPAGQEVTKSQILHIF